MKHFLYFCIVAVNAQSINILIVNDFHLQTNFTPPFSLETVASKAQDLSDDTAQALNAFMDDFIILTS